MKNLILLLAFVLLTSSVYGQSTKRTCKIKSSGKKIEKPVVKNTVSTITSIQNGDWASEKTWDSGRIPERNDNVVIKHQVKSAKDNSCSGLTINSGGKLTLESMFRLSCYGLLTNNGALIINEGDIKSNTTIVLYNSYINNGTIISIGDYARLISQK
ncbi:MAG: hypothetical protein ACOYN6_05895 [Ignavibacteria bacterium]